MVSESFKASVVYCSVEGLNLVETLVFECLLCEITPYPIVLGLFGCFNCRWQDRQRVQRRPYYAVNFVKPLSTNGKIDTPDILHGKIYVRLVFVNDFIKQMSPIPSLSSHVGVFI